MTDKISITFDEDNRIRVLDAEKYRETDQLKMESMEFIKKVKIVLKCVDVLKK